MDPDLFFSLSWIRSPLFSVIVSRACSVYFGPKMSVVSEVSYWEMAADFARSIVPLLCQSEPIEKANKLTLLKINPYGKL